mmetsp:Transcript_33259/g.52297  ORF Transcript_33259/g.52297 Transcript_33259/m.52297 type:complete len:256 (-) Transcript_33259:11-778(-)
MSITTSRLPPSLSMSPPGWMMVYFTPESIRYFSALRFQRRISPPVPSSFLPMVLRKLSAWLPPIELTTTTCFSFSFLARSIWFFWPIQSTSSGCPLGSHLNSGRPGGRFRSFPKALANSTFAMLKGRILGTAEVAITRASHPCIAVSRLAGSEISPKTIFPFPEIEPPTTFFSLLALFSPRTMPTASNPSFSSRFLKTSPPVFPPAPVTSTFVAIAKALTCARRAASRTKNATDQAFMFISKGVQVEKALRLYLL